MTLEEAKEFSLKKMICKQSQIPFLRLLDKIYEDFKLELEAEYKRGWKDRTKQSSLENRTCGNCKYKYIVDSMTTKCRNDNSPIDYLDLDCFLFFSCTEWEQE